MSSYSAAVLANGPIAYYRLGDKSPTSVALDSAPNHYTGSLSASGVTVGVTGALAGDSDTAMTFDGAAGNIVLPAGLSTSGWGAITLECWVNLTNNVFSNYPRLITNENNPDSNHIGVNFELAPSTDGASGYFSIGIGGSTFVEVAFGSGVLAANVWHHLVATYDGTTSSVYRNGVLVHSTTGSGVIGTTSTAIRIASDTSGGTNFAGTMDEIAIYNTALSANQVANHYTTGSTLVVPTPMYGSTALHDGKNYFFMGRPYDVSPVLTALYKVGRRVGMKTSGAIQNERVIPVDVVIASSLSLPDLESKKDALQQALFQQKQQQLQISTQDNRYFIADCIGFTANHAPMKGGTPGSGTGSGLLWVDCTITFLASYPFAYAQAVSTYDTGNVTLTQTSGTTYGFPSFSFAGGGTILAEPVIRIYNRTAIPALNNTTTTAQLNVNTAHTTISVAALPQAASIGDIFVLGWGTATQQSVTLSANAAQNATTLTVTSFTANATYPSGTIIDKDFSWTNVTITQANDAQTLVLSTTPGPIISAVNGDFLDIYCDPLLPLGLSIVKNSNPTAGLVPFSGFFPVVEPVSTNWNISITMNNLTPAAEAVFSWQSRYLS